MLPRRTKKNVLFVGVEPCSDALSFVKELLKAPNIDPGEQLRSLRHMYPSAALNRSCTPLTASGS